MLCGDVDPMHRWLRRVGSGLLGLGLPMAARVDVIQGEGGATPTHLIVLLHGTCCQREWSYSQSELRRTGPITFWGSSMHAGMAL